MMRMKNLFVAVVGCAGVSAFGFTPAGCPDLSLPRPAEVTYDAAGRPSDAEILFDGKDLSAWRSMDGGPARWPMLPDGTMKVDKTGNTPDKVVASVYTRSVYTNFQLHVEFRIPEECAKESSQWRGNSGVKIFGCYEVQILDSYRRDSYANGLCGALYCNWPPAVVASKPLGVWQAYDIVFHAPVVADGTVKERATVTVLQNGVVVQDHVHTPPYPKTAANELRTCGDIELQSHNDASAPISFRNVWIRRLPAREPVVEKGWRQWLTAPAKYADFKREVRPTAKYAFPDFDVECYEQRNGTDTVQRVMMAIPKNAKGKCPAVVAPFYFPEAMLGFNPVDGGLESDLAADGTNLTYYSEVAYMSDLARRGYITISADAYHLNYHGHEIPGWWTWPGVETARNLFGFYNWTWPRVGERIRADWPEWTGIGKLTFDTRLLVDLLCADKRVDASRIGIIGHSLGGKMAFYAGCLDPRIKVIVASDFGIGWDQTNWDADWYWGPVLEEVRAQGFDNSVLLEASGGKPFCLIAGKYDNEDSERTVHQVRQYGQTPSLFKFVNHATGHRPPRWATEEGYRFLDLHLKCKSNPPAVTRVGIIGCDTSHTIAFTKTLNVDRPDYAEGFCVTAAHKWGSKDIVSSTNRYEKYIAQLKDMGVEMCETVDDLLAKVDVVCLETNDGREHHWQAEKCFKAKKRVFIDKPIAQDYPHAKAIYDLGRKYGAEYFSTSTLRYASANAAARTCGTNFASCVFYAPCPLETQGTHSRYVWYGIHAFETAMTVMGRGVKSVRACSAGPCDFATITWSDGRVANLKLDRTPWGYGGWAFPGDAPPVPLSGPEGYGPMLKGAILPFFRTGVVPVPHEETLELFALMDAAAKSHAENGREVALAEIAGVSD